MSDASLATALSRGFAAEATEYVALLNRGLLELETGTDDGRRGQIIDELRRTAHTLKGSAGFTPFREVVERAHELESQIEALAGPAVDGGGSPFDALYAQLDSILRVFEREEDDRPSTDTLRTDTPLVDTGEESVRVPTRKLDALMSLIGEILVARVRGEDRLGETRRLRERIADLSDEWSAIRPGPGYDRRNARTAERRDRIESGLRESLQAATALQRELERDAMHMLILTDSLQNEIKRVRMQPIGVLFESFRRTARDLAVSRGKQVRVEIEGEDSEVDKKVLAEVREPLLHLIRNAIDHGLETEEERARTGKASAGRLHLRAMARARSIVIDVEDDGRGFDYSTIRRVAAAKDLLDGTPGDDQLAQLVFLPGFSTRSTADELSGRGVGLDAVRERVERLQGEISVASTPGRGTRFTLTLPLTLSTSRGLLVRACDATWAVPFTGIQRIIRVGDAAVECVDGHDAVVVDGQRIGLLRLAHVLRPQVPAESRTARQGKMPIVVIARGSERLALVVDALEGEQEMVVKSLGPHLRRVPCVAGAAFLGSGAVVAVLDPAGLFNAHLSRPRAVPAERAARTVLARVLVVEDSLTTRTLEKSILETAGYSVHAARDGVEALALLQRSEFDAVISDVNMPGMGGLELVRELRCRDATRDLPVILVTSLASERDLHAGLEAGANGYIVKTEFDQLQFLDMLRSVLG